MKDGIITIQMTGNDLFGYWANGLGKRLMNLAAKRTVDKKELKKIAKLMLN